MNREEAIRDLDIIRFNPHWDELVNEEYWEALMNIAITALQNQPEWIPVSERLPEKREDVLVCFDDTVVDSVIAWYAPKGGVWRNSSTGITLQISPVAWMPLPELYRESEVEDGKTD